MDDIFKDPEKMVDILTNKMKELIRLGADPEYIFKLKEENETLKEKLKNLEGKITELEAVKEEYEIQLSAATNIFTSKQLHRFIEWNNMRYAYNITPLSDVYKEIPRTIVPITPMPSTEENELDNILKIFVVSRLIESKSDFSEVWYRYFDIRVNLLEREIERLERKIDNIHVPEPKEKIIENESKSPEPKIQDQIALLQKEGYLVIPPPSRSEVESMIDASIAKLREEFKSELENRHEKSDIELFLEFLSDEKVVDKIIYAYMLYTDKITKDEFLNFININTMVGEG